MPANHDEIAGEVAQQNVVLDVRVLCRTSHAEAHVPVRGSVKRALCGLNGRLPDAHVTAAVFLGATVDMPEILLRTRAKAAAGGEHNRDEKGIVLIVLNNSRDSGASGAARAHVRGGCIGPRRGQQGRQNRRSRLG